MLFPHPLNNPGGNNVALWQETEKELNVNC